MILESFGNVNYIFDGDFIDFLDGIEIDMKTIHIKNIKTWVKDHNINPKYVKGEKLIVIKPLAILKNYEPKTIIYVNNIKAETAEYIISKGINVLPCFYFPFEKIEECCERML